MYFASPISPVSIECVEVVGQELIWGIQSILAYPEQVELAFSLGVPIA